MSAPARRRRIIITSDSEDGHEAAPQQKLPPAQPAPSRPSTPDADVSSGNDSSDSQPDHPICKKAREEKEAQAALQLPFLFAAKHGYFPKKTDIAPAPALPQPAQPAQPPPEVHPPPPLPAMFDDGYLWNARPPTSSQFLENEASHGHSQSSGTTGSSDGSLDDPDFIDKDEEPDYNHEEQAMMKQLFPLTYKSILKKAPIESPGPKSLPPRADAPQLFPLISRKLLKKAAIDSTGPESLPPRADAPSPPQVHIVDAPSPPQVQKVD